MSLFADYRPDEHGSPLDGVELRRATRDDLPAIARLMEMRGDGDRAGWIDRLGYFLDQGELIQVALHDEDLIGYGRLAWQTPGDWGGRNAPDGYYLSGMIVDPRYRRHGIGRALTKARCDWAWARGERVHFVVNALNQASMDLHRELGFRELTRDFDFPGITFTGGAGVLFYADASSLAQQVTQLRVGTAG